MHKHWWELVRQQLDLGINRMFYTCKCGAEKVTKYDLITERYLDAAE